MDPTPILCLALLQLCRMHGIMPCGNVLFSQDKNLAFNAHAWPMQACTNLLGSALNAMHVPCNHYILFLSCFHLAIHPYIFSLLLCLGLARCMQASKTLSPP